MNEITTARVEDLGVSDVVLDLDILLMRLDTSSLGTDVDGISYEVLEDSTECSQGRLVLRMTDAHGDTRDFLVHIEEVR